MKLQIVQPLVPHYRVPLFAKLAERPGIELILTASRHVPGIEGLKTHPVKGVACDYEHACRGMLGDRLMWQQGLDLAKDMGRGDVLVVSGNPRFLSNWPLVWKAKRRGVKCVWWGHAFGVGGNRIKNWIRLCMVRAFDAILLYTDGEIQSYVDLGIPPEKIFATNNGVDLELIDAARASWSDARLREFQETRGLVGKNLLVFCGRRVTTLDFATVFRALQLASEAVPDLELAIIGPSGEADQLKRLSGDIGVADRIHWVGELFEQEELAPWFLIAKAFIFPGSIGLSLLHAFGYGLPVILPRVIHRPEIAAFQEDETGLYYVDADARDLSVQIEALVFKESRRLIIAEACRQRVVEQFNIEMMVERFAECFISDSSGQFG